LVSCALFREARRLATSPGREYQFEITRQRRGVKGTGDEKAKNLALSILTLLQKCPVAVEFVVPSAAYLYVPQGFVDPTVLLNISCI
jgi:hypothetical protein